MKKSFSISVDTEIVDKFDEMIEGDRLFGNRSHAIEYSMWRLVEEREGEKGK